MAENSLRRLRRAAGFSSAKAFAESVGIPAPTYAKYEQIVDGPETPMPIKNAWVIADKLGCTIDAIVGREEIPEGSEQANVQAMYNGLTPATRALFDEFMEFALAKDEKEKRKAQQQQDDTYREVAEGYIRDLYALAATDRRYTSRVLFGSPDDARDAFECFARQKEVERISGQLVEMFDRQIDRDGGIKVTDDGVQLLINREDPDFERHHEIAVTLLHQQPPQEAVDQAWKEVEKIMRAYDAIRKGSEVVCRELGDDLVTAPEN